MPWPNSYSTGTVSIDAGATSAVGTGTFWSPLATQANLLIVGDRVAFVEAVADDTHLTIPAWQGDAIVDAEYRLVQFPLSSLQATRQLRDFLEQVKTQGIPYMVPEGEEPNDEIGEDGTVALRFDPKPVVYWIRVAGHYEFQGTFVGTAWRGEWESDIAYAVNNQVSRLGSSYISIAPSTNKPPESNPSFWSIASIGFRFIGTYSAIVAYAEGNGVISDGSLWIAVADSTGVTPGTDATKWRKGAQGITDANVAAAAASQTAAASSAAASGTSATNAASSAAAAATSATNAAASATSSASSASASATSAAASATSATASDAARTAAVVKAAEASGSAAAAAASAVAADVSADDAAVIVASIGDDLADAQAAAAAAAGSATAAQGYAAVLANPDYGFFADAPTDFRDYGSTWI